MHHQVGSSQDHNDAVERVLRQAEMSRLTRNLKSKLALASIQAQHGPNASQTPPPAGAGLRKRAKTLEGASPAPLFMASSEPARRPSQQKRHSLPSAGSAGSPPRRSSLSYKSASSSRTPSRPPSRPSSRPPSRTPSLSAIPPMPALPTAFAEEGHGVSYASENHRENAGGDRHRESAGSLMDAPVLKYPTQDQDDSQIPEPPRTPPQRRRALNTTGEVPQTPERGRDHEDGASLLLHFAHSPGHAATPRTPDFNMNDYLHFQTPSPARPARMATPRRLNHWGSLGSLSSLSSNIFVPAGGATADSAGPTPVKTSTLLSPTQRPPMPGIPSSHMGLEKSPSDL